MEISIFTLLQTIAAITLFQDNITFIYIRLSNMFDVTVMTVLSLLQQYFSHIKTKGELLGVLCNEEPLQFKKTPSANP